WSHPLSQVQYYCSAHSDTKGLRYGFIITDQNLVVLRFATEPIGDGLASARSQRGGSFHQRVTSGSTDLSFHFSTMSLGTGSQYTDSNLAGRQLLPPEYAVIPWAAHGTDKLTIKLSLFCLGLLAAFGEGHMCDGGYPGLKSWRKMTNGYVQPATGQTKRRLEKKDVLEDNVQAGQGSNQEYRTQDNDDGSNDQEEFGGDGNTGAFLYAE
ncbi:hypothetical protein V8F33_009030, partial [Rhypophila sp. PSN 637]